MPSSAAGTRCVLLEVARNVNKPAHSGRVVPRAQVALETQVAVIVALAAIIVLGSVLRLVNPSGLAVLLPERCHLPGLRCREAVTTPSTLSLDIENALGFPASIASMEASGEGASCVFSPFPLRERAIVTAPCTGLSPGVRQLEVQYSYTDQRTGIAFSEEGFLRVRVG